MIREVVVPWTGDSPCGSCTDFNTTDKSVANLYIDVSKFANDYTGVSETRGNYLRTEAGVAGARNYVFSYDDVYTEGNPLTSCHILDVDCLDCCGLLSLPAQKIPDEAFADPNNPTSTEIEAWFTANPTTIVGDWYAGGTASRPVYHIEIKSDGSYVILIGEGSNSSDITYDNSSSGGSSANIQGAIDELYSSTRKQFVITPINQGETQIEVTPPSGFTALDLASFYVQRLSGTDDVSVSNQADVSGSSITIEVTNIANASGTHQLKTLFL